MKEKAKSNTAVKKTAKKIKKAKPNATLNPGRVLKDISALVEANANKLAEAVMEEGMTGQVSQVKYLFEMAHIFPPTTDGSQTSADEHSLAETLLDRLHIPKTPVVHDELQKEADEDVMVIQPPKEKEAEESKESEDEEEKAEAVTVS